MTDAQKLIIFDFDFTIADTISEFNPFVSTWTPLPGAKKLEHYFRKFPEHTFIVTARYEHFEGRPLVTKFLEAIGIPDFPQDHIYFAGFLKNFHRKKADIIRNLIGHYRPRKVVLFDDGKANRDVIEQLENELPDINIVVVDPATGSVSGNATPDVDD